MVHYPVDNNLSLAYYIKFKSIFYLPLESGTEKKIKNICKFKKHGWLSDSSEIHS